MRTLVLLAVVVLISGCAGTPWYMGGNWDPYKPTDLEAAFGKAYYAAIENQAINPDASKNLSPVIGMDGESAEKIMDTFKQSFQKEQPVQNYIFNVGQGVTK